MKKVLLGISAGLALLGLGVGLYFIHPLAPVLLVLSVGIQIPIILRLMHARSTGSYRQRADARRRRYAQDADAERWLAAEEQEAAGPGVRFWSPAGRMLSLLNRAEALCALRRRAEAAILLGQVEPDALDEADRPRYEQVVFDLRENQAQPGVG